MQKFLAVAGLVAVMGATAAADEVTTYERHEQTSVTTVDPAAPATPEKALAQSTEDNLQGTVQSVDRKNRSLVLQKTDGENVRVSLNDDAQIYRRGQQIEYRDVEPNDVIQVRQAS
jgi:hypothetical protein